MSLIESLNFIVLTRFTEYGKNPKLAIDDVKKLPTDVKVSLASILGLPMELYKNMEKEEEEEKIEKIKDEYKEVKKVLYHYRNATGIEKIKDININPDNNISRTEIIEYLRKQLGLCENGDIKSLKHRLNIADNLSIVIGTFKKRKEFHIYIERELGISSSMADYYLQFSRLIHSYPLFLNTAIQWNIISKKAYKIKEFLDSDKAKKSNVRCFRPEYWKETPKKKSISQMRDINAGILAEEYELEGYDDQYDDLSEATDVSDMSNINRELAKLGNRDMEICS